MEDSLKSCIIVRLDEALKAQLPLWKCFRIVFSIVFITLSLSLFLASQLTLANALFVRLAAVNGTPHKVVEKLRGKP